VRQSETNSDLHFDCFKFARLLREGADAGFHDFMRSRSRNSVRSSAWLFPSDKQRPASILIEHRRKTIRGGQPLSARVLRCAQEIRAHCIQQPMSRKRSSASVSEAARVVGVVESLKRTILKVAKPCHTPKFGDQHTLEILRRRRRLRSTWPRKMCSSEDVRLGFPRERGPANP